MVPNMAHCWRRRGYRQLCTRTNSTLLSRPGSNMASRPGASWRPTKSTQFAQYPPGGPVRSAGRQEFSDDRGNFRPLCPYPQTAAYKAHRADERRCKLCLHRSPIHSRTGMMTATTTIAGRTGVRHSHCEAGRSLPMLRAAPLHAASLFLRSVERQVHSQKFLTIDIRVLARVHP